uniref:Golgi to ER traffic protein 4 n=1 Tax=Romanomermis culicivorax TaxID=13658 RepID=A0A915JLZ1_ROMCU
MEHENGATAVNRIEKKLRQKLDEGDYYEAHQIYRTLYFRYVAQKKFDDLIDLLFDGASSLLKADQIASGIDLSILYVDTLTKYEEKVIDEKVLTSLDSLLSFMKPVSELAANKEKFLQESVKWSASKSGNVRGSPELHAKFANTLWKQKEYSQARRHFLWSNDALNCAKFLVDYHTTQGSKDESDLFIAQATLQLLVRKNIQMARAVFSDYLRLHPTFADQSSSKPPLATPLLDFIYFVLESIDRQTTQANRLQIYTILIEKYQSSIDRDPSYKSYLDKIGQIFFGLPQPKPKSGGFLSNLLNDLMKDDDDEDGEDAQDDNKEKNKTNAGLPTVVQDGTKPDTTKSEMKPKLREEELD